VTSGEHLPALEEAWLALEDDVQGGTDMRDALAVWAETCRLEGVPKDDALVYAGSQPHVRTYLGAVEEAYEAPEPERPRPERETCPEIDRWSYLLSVKNLRIQPTAGNLDAILANDTRVAGRIRYDAFRDELTVTEATPFAKPGPWTDSTGFDASVWIERAYAVAFAPARVDQAAKAIGLRTPCHPVQDYLAGLTWDGECRLDTWLTDYLGTSDWVYARSIARAFLIGAVARAFKPGFEVGGLLCISGDVAKAQRALRILFGPYLADEMPVRWRRSAPGVWCQMVDPSPDGRTYALATNDGTVPRTFITAAATLKMVNKPGCWTVPIERRVRLEGLEAARDQLFAEAYRAFLDGEKADIEPRLRDVIVPTSTHEAWATRLMDAALRAYKDDPIEVNRILKLAGLSPPGWVKYTEVNRAEDVLVANGWKRSVQGWVPGWRFAG